MPIDKFPHASGKGDGSAIAIRWQAEGNLDVQLGHRIVHSVRRRACRGFEQVHVEIKNPLDIAIRQAIARAFSDAQEPDFFPARAEMGGSDFWTRVGGHDRACEIFHASGRVAQ